MSISDRLDQIEADIPLAARSPEMAQHFTADHGPELVAAARAVLDVCDREIAEPWSQETDMLARNARDAITTALGEDTP